ncbi:MAG: hypothetical protein B7Z78_01200 [Rhodospirillales bacterium 20-60-12]|nr:MAG: hypothetical protein B7Z78_01200 [Rhodospirillales bacterium 20-60-12]HQT66912.1 photosynthetic complex putative assembly protein PuhB [Acetobacteraceae bacterium]
MSRMETAPVDGLPGPLPADETKLWQGSPRWQSLAVKAFKIRIVGYYFAALVVWRIAGSMMAGHDFGYALSAGTSGIALGAAAIGLFSLFAWFIARSTTYTITSKRVVITYGVALPKSINLPFRTIDAVDMRRHADGTGDIALRLQEQSRLSYLLLWPHVKAGKQGRNEPVLRCIPAPESAARMLGEGLGQGVSIAPATALRTDADMLQAHAA